MISKFVLGNILLASAALAAPSSQQGARRQENHQSQPVNSSASSARAASTGLDLNPAWAGAVVSQDNRAFTTVTGTFTVPTLSGAGGGNSGFSIWVAIDGYTCQNGLLAGIGANFIDGMPGVLYNAWYELQPGYTQIPGYASYDISGITIHAGDVITVTVTVAFTDDEDVYTVVMENQTNGQLVSAELLVPSDSEFALCGRDAQWGVGVFRGPEGSPPLADFGTVTLTNAIATGLGVNGNDYNPLDATILRDIVRDRDGDLIIFTYVNTARDSVLVQYLSGQ